MFPDYQNSIRILWRGQSSETSSYEPQSAHSTGLPKPPGYNLKWSRVTPIQDALVTRPPTKASHHEHPLKRCRKLPSRTISGPKSPGTHLTPLGGNWVDRLAVSTLPPSASLSAIAWYIPLASPGTTHHQGFYCTISPGGTIPTAKRPARTMTTIVTLPLGDSCTLLGTIPVAQCYWFLVLKNRSQWTTNHSHTKL